MNISRLFSYEKFKGSYLYLDTQKKYEIARTVLYFAISFAIFFTGIYLTGSKKNLLTIVAVLGMLPASKSLVSVIMFCRFKSFTQKISEIKALSAYDMVFTSEKINYHVYHLCVSGGSVIGYSPDKNFDENKFKDHIRTYLSSEGIDSITIKVFNEKNTYLSRINDLKASDEKDKKILSVLKQLVL